MLFRLFRRKSYRHIVEEQNNLYRVDLIISHFAVFFRKLVFSVMAGRTFLLAIALLLCLRRDTVKLRVVMELRHGGQAGKSMPLRFRLEYSGRLIATGSVLVELQIRNVMFHTIEKKRYLIPLENEETVYELDWPVKNCGEILFHCEKIQVRDVLRLFALNIPSFEDLSMVCYPAPMKVQAEISGSNFGISREEGMTLNRKGNEPSEMFDIREYVPGDDIRSIHWKLSSKTEELILRQTSEPSHYDAAIMPDFGRDQWGAPMLDAEADAAIALGTALAEQLVAQYYALGAEEDKPETNELKIMTGEANRERLYVPASLAEIKNGRSLRQQTGGTGCCGGMGQ